MCMWGRALPTVYIMWHMHVTVHVVPLSDSAEAVHQKYSMARSDGGRSWKPRYFDRSIDALLGQGIIAIGSQYITPPWLSSIVKVSLRSKDCRRLEVITVVE